MKLIAHLAAALLALCIPLALASPPSAAPKITGTYSTLAYHAEGGDVLGIELSIVYTQRGYYVIYQSSEGEHIVPVVVPAQIKGTRLAFTLPNEADPRGSFHGRIERDAIRGNFSGNRQTVTLPRKSSYWNP